MHSIFTFKRALHFSTSAMKPFNSGIKLFDAEIATAIL